MSDMENSLLPRSATASPAPPDPIHRALPGWLPSGVKTRVESLRRDLGVLVDGLRGRHPSPLIGRTLRKQTVAGTASRLHPRTLRVVEVVRETADAVTLWLADPAGAPLAFEAGQFLTLLLSIDGGAPVRRAYSASSAPAEGGRIAITSKRVAGGLVSSYLNDRVAVGQLVQVLGPSGSFTPRPQPERRRHLVLIGGGSGITPLMSILRTVLAVETGSRVTLLYGNRGESDIIFYRQLGELAASHPERLTVRHVLSEPPPGWSGGVGLLDEATVAAELGGLPAGAAELPTEFYLCGPEPMMAAARAVLLRGGVAPAAIHEERFATLRYSEAAAPAGPQPLELRLPGQGPRPLTVAAGETLLEAGLRQGAAMPFSCALGGCGACKGRLVAGEVTMPEPNCLTAAEREGGYVLCCVARPRTPVTIEIEG